MDLMHEHTKIHSFPAPYNYCMAISERISNVETPRVALECKPEPLRKCLATV